MAKLKVRSRLTIIAAYVVAFWVALPFALTGLGLWLDSALRWTREPSAWGWLLLIAGLAFLAWAALWLRLRGHGLPIGALPPPRLVVSGPYGLVRHPMYVGYNVALVGLALVVGSLGLLLVGGPLFLAGWIVYALIEERALRSRFGAEYRAYQKDVGIWPRLPLYRIVQVLVAARVLPVIVEGRANVPAGPCVVVANHACYLDPAFLTRVTRRHIRFLATAEAFRTRLLGWALRRAGAIPLRRYAPDAVACRALVRQLAAGRIVGVFVETERSPLGVYQGAVPRVATVVARLGVPVIPVGICGDYDAGPRWAGVLRRRQVTLRVGTPVQFAGADPAHAINEAITSLLEGAVPRVHLHGLPLARLARVLWACPSCLEETLWDAAALRCAACGARFTPTAEGLLSDQDGREHTLAALGQRLVDVAPDADEIAGPAEGFREHTLAGRIGPLEPLGGGTLHLTRAALTFVPLAANATAPTLTIPLREIRSVTTERADTLQVATRTAMWQFQPAHLSVFRLQAMLAAWIVEPHLERSTPLVPHASPTG